MTSRPVDSVLSVGCFSFFSDSKKPLILARAFQSEIHARGARGIQPKEYTYRASRSQHPQHIQSSFRDYIPFRLFCAHISLSFLLLTALFNPTFIRIGYHRLDDLFSLMDAAGADFHSLFLFFFHETFLSKLNFK